MANPTGTTYLTAASGYVWTDGDVYQIAQTDQQEGAAVGASFSGLGVDNQPHQTLLNKIELVHNNQLTDEANISGLQSFKGLFTGAIGANGYLKVGIQDVSRGLIDYIIQWGVYNAGVTGDTQYSVSWPVAFPNAIYWAGATIIYVANASPDLGVGVVSLTNTGGAFYINRFNVNGSATGFYWMAIGF